MTGPTLFGNVTDLGEIPEGGAQTL
jgi:hypothetical protein